MYKAAWLNLVEWLKEKRYTEVIDKMTELLLDEVKKVEDYQKEMRK